MSLFATSNIVELCAVAVSPLVAWITAIPFEQWPQQNRLEDGQMRPAMVNDGHWNGLAKQTDELVQAIMDMRNTGLWPSDRGYLATRNRMLSVVMPGHSITPHRDRQPPGWICRVHVPLTTNDRAIFRIGDETSYMLDRDKPLRNEMHVGRAYAVNVQAYHWIRNDGTTPRIHFMFDVMRA